MSLTMTPEMLIDMGVQPCNCDSGALQKYDQLRQKVEAAIKSYVKWEIEAATVTEFYSGNNTLDLVLERPHVTAVANVWWDPRGGYGFTPNTFGANTLLTVGVDYVPVLERNQIAESGRLRRLASYNPYWFPSDLVFNRSMRRSGLSYWGGPVWLGGSGNVKVEYSYGYDPVPQDIKLAVSTMVGVVVNAVKYGYPTTNESFADYNYGLSIARDLAMGEVRQLLSTYRNTSIGLGF